MYFTWTGNPFVDAGAFALGAWLGKEPEEVTLEDLAVAIDSLVEACVGGPLQNLVYAVFPNNPVTNPSVKPGDKERTLRQDLLDMVAKLEPLGESGTCTACGRRSANFPVGRSKMPLTGSGGNRNFFAHAGEGADLCGGCTLATQFLPFVLDRCGRNMVFLHSGNRDMLGLWYRRKVTERKKLLQASSEGSRAQPFRYPENYLLKAAEELIMEIEMKRLFGTLTDPVNLRLYVFLNGQQEQFIDFHDLPAPVFRFLAQVKQLESAEKKKFWWPLVRRGFQWNKKEEADQDTLYRQAKNEIFQKLLTGQTIVPYFIVRDQRRVIGNWQILAFYLKEVREMTDERIQAIQQFADRLAEQIKAYDSGKKRLAQLEMAKSYARFRNVLLRMVHDRVANGAEEPLVYFEEYVNYLFPDSAAGWNETRDLIFFRLYEQLHPWLVEQGLTPVAEEDEEEAVEELEK